MVETEVDYSSQIHLSSPSVHALKAVPSFYFLKSISEKDPMTPLPLGYFEIKPNMVHEAAAKIYHQEVDDKKLFLFPAFTCRYTAFGNNSPEIDDHLTYLDATGKARIIRSENIMYLKPPGQKNAAELAMRYSHEVPDTARKLAQTLGTNLENILITSARILFP